MGIKWYYCRVFSKITIIYYFFLLFFAVTTGKGILMILVNGFYKAKHDELVISLLILLDVSMHTIVPLVRKMISAFLDLPSFLFLLSPWPGAPGHREEGQLHAGSSHAQLKPWTKVCHYSVFYRTLARLREFPLVSEELSWVGTE